MRALITGASGFIGSHLSDELLSRGHTVIGVDRRPSARLARSHQVLLDLADNPAITGLEAVVRDADVVFHLAAQPGVRSDEPFIEHARHRDNVVATHHLLSVTPPSTPVVATSSSSVYGGSKLGDDGPRPSKETDELRPRGGYARSKVQMEDVCTRHRDDGATIAVVRPFTVVGERQRPDMAFAIWLEALKRGEPIEIFGSGRRSRDITDIRDAVAGLIRVAETRHNGTINLGTGAGHTLVEMVTTLVEASGIEGRVTHRPVPEEDVTATLADTSRCEHVLGFVPSTDLGELLERLVQADRTTASAAS